MSATPTTNFADRLTDAIDRLNAPACVGLDPVVESLPAALSPKNDSAESCASAIESFSLGVIDAVDRKSVV